MVVLIAGSSHTGKTLAAQKLLERYHYPYLCIDHLKMGLIRSGVCGLSPESPDRELTPYLWGVVKEIVKTAVENGQNLVVEGCYIPFDWKKDFEPTYLAQIRYICLIFSARYLEERFSEVERYANVIETRKGGGACARQALLRENLRNLGQCRTRGLEYRLIDGEYSVEIEL